MSRRILKKLLDPGWWWTDTEDMANTTTAPATRIDRLGVTRCANHAAVMVAGAHRCTDHMAAAAVAHQAETGEKATIVWHDQYGQRVCGAEVA
jgi:hypothetical protein